MSTLCVDQRLWVEELDLRPDAIALARACERAGLDAVTLLHGSDAEANESEERGRAWQSPDGYRRYSFIAAAPDRSSRALDPTVDDDAPAPPAMRSLDVGSASAWAAPRWIGVVPYESRRTLERASWTAPEHRPEPILCEPEWWRFPAVLRVDHRSGRVAIIGAEPDAIERLRRATAELAPAGEERLELHVLDDEPPEAHLSRVRRALELIHAGDLYQVNVARQVAVALERGSLLGLHQRLVRAAPARFSALLRLGGGVSVLSTSPELLLHAQARNAADELADPGTEVGSWPRFERLITEPIKGTRPRGRDAAEDRRQATELDADPKERAELTMIVDVERNDLGRVSRVGSVQLTRPPQVTRLATVFHRVARVESEARGDASRQDVLEAVVPSGSVTGAPKVRAMEVVRELEAHRRGLYTGGLGYVAHDGSVALAMAIRTLVLRDGHGAYWTGGGIVADSVPEQELSETSWKAVQLFRAAGLASDTR